MSLGELQMKLKHHWVTCQYLDEMENLKKYGDNYLALQSIERSKSISGGKTAE